jgi:hypothetical protein
MFLSSCLKTALFALRIDDLFAKRGLDEMLWKYIFLEPFQDPSPSQIIRKVFRRYSTEFSLQPGFEPFVIAVDRLDVVNLIEHWSVPASSDRFHRNAEFSLHF